MTIKFRILALVAGFALMASAITALGLVTINDYNHMLLTADRAHENAYRGEHLNRLVTGVVMDSRGVYMSQDTSEAARYGAGIDDQLGQIQTLLTQWKGDLKPGELAGLDGEELEEMLHFGAIVAGLNCAHKGCVPPTRAEVDAILNASD